MKIDQFFNLRNLLIFIFTLANVEVVFSEELLKISFRSHQGRSNTFSISHDSKKKSSKYIISHRVGHKKKYSAFITKKELEKALARSESNFIRLKSSWPSGGSSCDQGTFISKFEGYEIPKRSLCPTRYGKYYQKAMAKAIVKEFSYYIYNKKGKK